MIEFILIVLMAFICCLNGRECFKKEYKRIFGYWRTPKRISDQEKQHPLFSLERNYSGLGYTLGGIMLIVLYFIPDRELAKYYIIGILLWIAGWSIIRIIQKITS